MPWTTEELEAIETAYKSGITEIHYKDRVTKFRSLREMERILKTAGSTLTQRDRQHYQPSYDRGYQ